MPQDVARRSRTRTDFDLMRRRDSASMYQEGSDELSPGRPRSLSESLVNIADRVRVPVRLLCNDEDPCSRLLHVCCNDEVGVLFALSELLLRHNIDIGFADIITVGDHVDNRFYLRAARAEDFEDADEWCQELETFILKGSRAARSAGSRGRSASGSDDASAVAWTQSILESSSVPVAAAKLAVNPHLLCISSFRKLGEARADEADGDSASTSAPITERYEMKIKGINQAGLLAYMSLILAKSGFSIRRAHIETRGCQISDMFEVSTVEPDAVRRLKRFVDLPAVVDDSLSCSPLEILWANDLSPANAMALIRSVSHTSCTFTEEDRLHLPNGDVYDGSLCGDDRIRQGYGVYHYASKQALYLRYAGQWHQNMKHGFGSLLYRDGSAYVGFWKQNQRHGVGLMFGYGSAGARGQGTMPTYRYEGEWHKDRQHGIGVELTDDYLYCGHFIAGAHNGAGIRCDLRQPGVDGCSVVYGSSWQPLVHILAADSSRARGGRFQALAGDHCSLLSPPAKSAQTLHLGRREFQKASLDSLFQTDEVVKEDDTKSSDRRLPDALQKSMAALGSLESDLTAAVLTPQRAIHLQKSNSSLFDLALDAPKENQQRLKTAECTVTPTTRASRRSLTPGKSKVSKPIVASPMLWSEQELATIVGSLEIGVDSAERIACSRLAGAAQLAEMSNRQLSEDFGLELPLERLVVRRLLRHLLEADRWDNSCRGRCVRDVQNDPDLRKHCIPIDQLTLDAKLSQGGFGVVYRGIVDLRGTKGRQVVAAKEMLGDYKVRLYELMKEARIMASLNHPNVCKFVGICADARQKGKRYILSELMHCSLFDLYHRPATVPFNGKLTVALSVSICEGICAGVAYIHGRSLVHADLKSSNILMDLTLRPEDGHKPIPRICDFGHAVIRDFSTPHDRLCTPHWASPEVLRGEGLSPAADVFSLGVMLWEMLTRKMPHRELCYGHVIAAVGWAGEVPDMRLLPDGLPQEIRALLDGLLQFAPAERPSSKKALWVLRHLPQGARREGLLSLLSFFVCNA